MRPGDRVLVKLTGVNWSEIAEIQGHIVEGVYEPVVNGALREDRISISMSTDYIETFFAKGDGNETYEERWSCELVGEIPLEKIL